MPVRLGSFIRERRQELGLTQEQLAERIGDTVRQAEVSRLEHNRITLPRRERLSAIAAALDVSLGELLVRTGWMEEVEGAGLDALDAAAVLEVPEAIAQVPDPDAATELDSVRSALDRALAILARTSDALEQTRGALDTLQRLLEDHRNPRGEVHPQTGVVEDWEDMLVFCGP